MQIHIGSIRLTFLHSFHSQLLYCTYPLNAFARWCEGRQVMARIPYLRRVVAETPISGWEPSITRKIFALPLFTFCCIVVCNDAFWHGVSHHTSSHHHLFCHISYWMTVLCDGVCITRKVVEKVFFLFCLSAFLPCQSVPNPNKKMFVAEVFSNVPRHQKN